MEEDKKQVFTFSIGEGFDSIICENLEQLLDMIRHESEVMEPGDTFIIKSIEMTQEEIDSAPEFEGF